VASKRRADLECDCEMMVCEVCPDKSTRIALVLGYRPPDYDKHVFNQYLETTLCNVFKEYSHVCLLGDYNMPSLWSKSGTSNCAHDLEFLDIVESYCLEQINNVPSNKHGNLLDLVFTNACELYSDVCDMEQDFPTDHTVLGFDIAKPVKPIKGPQRTVYNYKRANIQALQNILHDKALENTVITTSDVNTAWCNWSNAVMDAIDKCIPKVTIKNSSQPPWFDSEVRHLINVKNTAWRKAKKKNSKKSWSKFRKLRNKIKKVLTVKYDNYIASLGDLCKENPKRFWSFFNCKTKTKGIPDVISNGTNEYCETPDKANCFNKYFQSVFLSERDVDCTYPEPSSGHGVSHNGTSNDPVNQNVTEPVFSSNIVLSVLRDLDVNSAGGPDGLSPFILKHCCQELAPSLAILFNKSMQSGILPIQWKHANVTPAFKLGSGDKHIVNNYRPISLLCVVSKVMERCIHDHLYPFVKDKIHNLQHGFMKKRSCTTQLLKVYNTVGACLDKGHQVDLVYLDFSKAFDTISHTLLIGKLRNQYNFSNKLLTWIVNYLEGRRQRVVMNNCTSEWLDVTSGVPQGSILGPLLFLLYINDMPSVSTSCTTALFADDAKCIKEILSQHDCVTLQNHLDKLYEWSVKWKMSFNPKKCKVLTVSRTNKFNFTYALNGVPLENVGTFRDLGVVVDKTLSWSPHIEGIISKAKKVCAMVRRSLGYKAPSNVKLQLYSSLCRSKLEYSSQVWSPYTKQDIKSVEAVQRGMTRYITCNKDLTYTDRCKQLKLLPLSYRREIADLTFLYKYLNGAIDVDFSSDLQVDNVNSRLRSASQGIQVHVNLVRTESYMGSFFNRVAYLWNKLPLEVKTCDTLHTFKAKLNVLYFSKLNVYDVDNPCSWTSVCRCNTCLCNF